jgi:site-specific recombinase XerD
MNMKFIDGANLFYSRCVGLNLANSTILSYQKGLLDFAYFLTEANISDILKVKPTDILNYLSYIKRKRLAPVTVADRYILLRAFYNFLVQYDYLTESPLRNIKKPKVPKKHARTFTNNEVEAILNYFDKDTFTGYRNYTIMCILFSTGMRKSELLGLTVLDVHLDENIVTVLGKGNKTREIPIGNVLRKVLKKYLRDRGELLTELSAPFTPKLLIGHKGEPLTIHGLDTVFRQLKLNLSIPKVRLSPHTWRHTFAKTFLLNGGDIFSLQRMLGHEDISTTQIYVDYTTQELKVQNEKFNPLNNHRWQYC